MGAVVRIHLVAGSRQNIVGILKSLFLESRQTESDIAAAVLVIQGKGHGHLGIFPAGSHMDDMPPLVAVGIGVPVGLYFHLAAVAGLKIGVDILALVKIQMKCDFPFARVGIIPAAVLCAGKLAAADLRFRCFQTCENRILRACCQGGEIILGPEGIPAHDGPIQQIIIHQITDRQLPPVLENIFLPDRVHHLQIIGRKLLLGCHIADAQHGVCQRGGPFIGKFIAGLIKAQRIDQVLQPVITGGGKE